MMLVWTSSMAHVIVAVALYITLTAAKAKSASKQHQVMEMIPHDASCYTQGLVFHRRYLYESCGNYGESSVRIVNPDTGDVLKVEKIPSQYFAEGLAAVDDRLYLLTWNEKTMFELDADTLGIRRTLTFDTHSGEGWGLAYDERQQRLVVSDGSSHLTFFSVPLPDDGTSAMVKTGAIVVHTGGQSQAELTLINELEMSPDGLYVYANLWYKDEIVKIDLSTGTVVGTLYMRRLYPQRERPPTADCLNGIAYNATDDTLLLTGKLWPSYYRVKVHKATWQESPPPADAPYDTRNHEL